MANLIANSSTANWTGNWSTVESASLKTDGTSSVNVTTGNLDSTAFILAAVALDGVALNISSRAASPTGTFTVILRNSTTATNVQTVTINVSDLPAGSYVAGANGSWAFFKFGATHTPNGTDSYVIRVTTSNATQVGLYATTANNWNRMLRRTTTATIAAADTSFILGEYTGTGTKNDISVTQNNNNTTAFGTCIIGYYGTLTWTTSATTNLRLGGNLVGFQGGNYYQGTDASPIGAAYTSKLEFNNASAGQYGVIFNGSFNYTFRGADKTVSWSLLNADVSAGATSLTIADSVGSAWKNGDTLLITSTTRTIAETETKTMTADGSGTTLTVNALAYAHGGNSTTMIQGEVGNLTRNLKITTVTAANAAYIQVGSFTTGYFKWVEMIDLNNSTFLTNQTTTTGSLTIDGCSIYCTSAKAYGVYLNSTITTLSITNSVFYNFSSNGIQLNTNINNSTFTNLLIATCTTYGFAGAGSGWTLTNFRAASCSSAGLFLPTLTGAISGDNINCHSCNNGIAATGIMSTGTINNIVSWRNTANGIINNYLGSASSAGNGVLTFKNGYIFGNATSGFTMGGTVTSGAKLIFDSINFDAGTTLTQPLGADLRNANSIDFYDCNFGVSQTHSTADITISGKGPMEQIRLFNTVLNSTNKVTSYSNLNIGSYINFSKYQGLAGTYISYLFNGTLSSDTTSLGFTSTVSEKLIPNSNTTVLNLESAPKQIALSSGQTATVTVKVRKGTSYNGINPRLMVRRNAYGVTSDTVLATGTSGIGVIDTLTGTTVASTGDGVFDFFVDCTGTAGFINLTDWSKIIS